MTLQEAVEDIELRVPRVIGEDALFTWTKDSGASLHFDPNGVPFVAVCSGGVKLEGEMFPCLCSTEDLAVELWRNAMIAFLGDNPAYLCWRQRPVMESVELSPATIAIKNLHHGMVSTRYAVYSRVSVVQAGTSEQFEHMQQPSLGCLGGTARAPDTP